ncbi:acyl carrier protein [Aestuariibacter sp. AA17]|uniref:Acyl carrier protein n=1 Tax=Fluctibacter corallii TaxID=2984329 RepID=A0ABT3A884_9ALTE|nr:acyl carrier protein [Aestuariibacter sp. AA17]MCV2884825.1 acyl carrier protein [Aestuariibacter sp. AA17]
MDMTNVLLEAAQQVFQYQVEVDTPINSIPGSSLQLMHFKAQIESKTGCTIPLEQLYQVTTVRQLANVISQPTVAVTSGDI